VARWATRTAARGAGLTPPTPAAVADECRQWLEGIAADLAAAAAARGLLDGVASLADLAALESDVASTTGGASPSVERACVAVLGRTLDAWARLAEAPHVLRAQAGDSLLALD